MDKETLLQLGADEVLERPIRYSRIQILDYKPSRVNGPLLAREGTITIFIAHKGASILDRVREACRAEAEADVELANYLIDSFRGRKQVTRYLAWTLLHNSPVFADIRYGGKTLANNLFPPPDAEVVILENPYNGVRIHRDELTLVEHPRDESPGELDAVALVHSPRLTEAEAAALEQVPDDQLELNVIPALPCCDDITEYAQRVVFITFTVTCLCATEESLVATHLAEEELRSLGPAKSARRLMALRRDALGHDHPSSSDGE